MQRLGVPAAQIAAGAAVRKALARQAQGPGVQVPPHLWPAIKLFEAMQTQWQVAMGMGGLWFVGLNYAALECTANWVEIDITRHRKRLFAWLRTMEAEAKTVLNQR